MVAAAAMMIGVQGAVADPVSISSPDGKIRLAIDSNGGQLTWSVTREGKSVTGPAPLGLVIDGNDIGQGVTLGSPHFNSIDEKYPIRGNHPEAVNRCQEMFVPVEAGGIKFEVDARAFDDGAAVRLKAALADGVHTIAGETTSWSLPQVNSAWWARYEQSNEAICQMGGLDSVPANVSLSVPLTTRDGNGLYVSLTEANNDSFPDMGVQRVGNSFRACFPASARGWSQQGPVTTPWRVVIVTSNLNDLVNSDMVTNLCPPPPRELAEADWIKPGKALWEWWSSGAPKLQEQHTWMDAAKRLGFDYYLIDDGWRNWRAEGKDQWQCLKEVIEYGKSQGVASLVWVNSSEMRSAAGRRAYLEKVAALGASGIKIDFIPACTAEVTKWYEETLKDTAELHLMCNFHGAVKPTGRRRTWPHELTREAIRGLEYHLTRYRRVLPDAHDEILPFTRLISGPADYTPTTFDPRELSGYTWGHMLAQAVDMTSPLLHFGGGYKDFVDNPAEEFLRRLPTTWDQTIVLPGSEPGKTVGFARRQGRDWYIGVLNGGTAGEMKIDLSFIGEGSYSAEIFGDDPANPAAFKREDPRVTSKTTLTATLSVRGGFVAWIKRPAN
ncbi:MAG TPA: glycoside hydrolase family 97 catalytic domain-containing protein [Phycisphaerae bacterium]|jgi:alpha-glucosidase|nr:glycoside hydrolase family 97 catalytic domain-containing protein [Phycisphaerae bacterium]